MSKKFWKAAGIRALRTFCQNLISTIPAGFIVTPVMLKELDISIMYVIAAWLVTAVIAAGVSVLTSIATGLPETELDAASDE